MERNAVHTVLHDMDGASRVLRMNLGTCRILFLVLSSASSVIDQFDDKTVDGNECYIY